MAYVFTQKLEGTKYDEEVGLVYRVPSRLLRILGGITPGARFVYYQPQEGKGGRVFFGSGVVDHVDEAVDPARVHIRDYRPFRAAVPKLLGDGAFAETGSTSSPFYLWSVRFVADGDIDRIVGASVAP